MDMKQYLLDTWAFNDRANKQVLARIRDLPDTAESIRFFSHLINSQKKWLARIHQFPKDPNLDWWEPGYALEDLERAWDASLAAWREFVADKSEQELFAEVKWVGYDGKTWTAPLKDIALQLNYHSIHHRAQIQTLIRAQGQTPDFVDYIGTVYRRVD